MNEIQYQGEHLWVQYLGHALIILSFFSAIYVSWVAISSYKKKEYEIVQFQKWSLYGLKFHALSLLSIIGLILFLMMQKYYEFHYAWEHVSDDLPMKYILSAFWEGQEGSFLLWMFWNMVICFMLYRHYNQFTWMNIGLIMIVQAILMTMILGKFVLGMKMGSNPFLLLRQTMDIPLFKNPDYVSLVKGNGMNPLLQNYWMIIHPPTLFLGFSSTIIPFVYALSGLILGKYTEWLKPCLKWSLFSASFLGLGILMGGIWAYEALSFGGYWAWDPVENMSLVPWLVLIAGIHSHLISQSTGYSIKATAFFYFLSYSLVIYSTYLTRSGVLGDTSVHAFTGLGLGWQLVGFIFAVLLFPLYFLIKSRNNIPTVQQEERIESREFWMFIGSLILMFSAILISFTTSIPVYNKLLDFFGGILNQDWKQYHRSAPVDVVAHHNRFQIWIAVIIALLSGFGLYLRYLGQKLKGLSDSFLKNIGLISLIAAFISAGVFYFLDQKNESIYVLLFSSFFAVLSNLYYLIKNNSTQPKVKSAVLSHIGFGLLLLGIIFTGLNRKNIVPDKFFQEDMMFESDPDGMNRHFLLFKNEAKFANGYWLNLKHDTLVGRFRKYTIDVQKEDSSGNKLENFTLYPDVQYDNKLTKVAAANPYIRHYWNRDLFTLIAQIPSVQMDAETAQKVEDSLKFTSFKMKLNDTVYGQKNYYILTHINKEYIDPKLEMDEEDFGLQLSIAVGELGDTIKGLMKPSVVFKTDHAYKLPETLNSTGTRADIMDSLAYDVARINIGVKTEKFKLREGEEFVSSTGVKFKFVRFNKEPKSSRLQLQEGDIALGAVFEILKDDKQWNATPIYLIRDRQESFVPYINYAKGIQLEFTHIDPETATMDFIYTELKVPDVFPVRMAEDVPRTDYVVMEIIVFPGINLVWLGSLMMVFGLALASYYRKK